MWSLLHSVVPVDSRSTISGIAFVGYGTHYSAYPTAYFTAAAAIGLEKAVRPNEPFLDQAFLNAIHHMRVCTVDAPACGRVCGQAAQDLQGVHHEVCRILRREPQVNHC